ncbi:MAG: 2Fe-2S iron-sulfur cluster binding domain-containing protein [Clostridium sp.]|nr:2Fe-2S iron-sulfur cluster binding domain-containing protein [Clostridium sp.]
MKMVNLNIDGKNVSVEEGTTVLEACRNVNIDIPTLCFLEEVNEIGACRLCLVEVENNSGLHAACVLPCSEGMSVKTNSPAIRETRKVNLELILSNHDRKCLTCVRNTNCELQDLAERFGITDISFEGEMTDTVVDDFSPSIVRDTNKCILCRRCIAVCSQVQEIGVIGATDRGFNTKVGPAFELSINNVPCINCGQCIIACPVGALKEKDDAYKVWNALNDDDKIVVVQTAPATRVALGEEFNLPIGSNVKGEMVTALKMMGFDMVYDTNFAADLTILEEGTELLSRINNGGKLPLITSCSPGWVKFCEDYYPDYIDNLSSCKSPHQMLGALVKSYYAEKQGIDPEKIFVVSVMPCTAKKFESERDEMKINNIKDVDAVLTTREIARMIKEAGIDFVNLEKGEYDPVFGDSSGAGALFGATGGVMEAALRTVFELITGRPLDNLEINAVRGLEGVKEATIDIDGLKVSAAVAHGMKNARKILDKVKNGEKEYHFIEIMGCPGGCITGGGQPIVKSKTVMEKNVWNLRAEAIYNEDRSLNVRTSHENPSIIKIYDTYLGKPNSEKAHELLHTTYIKRKQYNNE